MKKTIILLTLLITVTLGCKKLDDLGAPTPVEIDFTTYDYGIGAANNHMTKLGKFLFYDENLSINNSRSCGSCHIQKMGFADGLPKSLGFSNRETVFHSMALSNLRANSSFFWNIRENDINRMSLLPVADHIEMGLPDFELLIAKIDSIPYYQELFKNAFGHSVISKERISSALSTFVLSLQSTNSKNNKVNIGKAEFTENEKRGRDLFNGKYNCASCHNPSNNHSPWWVLHSGTNSANIGLNANPTEWNEVSKIPNLVNIAKTAPYMHDGRFKTLEEVLDHYSNGIKGNPFLSDIFKNSDGSPLRLNISAEEKKEMIAFLHTLTDDQFLNDIRFSNPFTN